MEYFNFQIFKYSILKDPILCLTIIPGNVKGNDIKISNGSNGLIIKMGEEITLTYENNNGMKSKTGKLITIDGYLVKLKYSD